VKPLYALQGGVKVSAQLLNGTGAEMSTLAVTDGSTPDERRIDLPLSALAPGNYGVRVSVDDAAIAATEVIAFRVTP
jgi:hypothetical protein